MAALKTVFHGNQQLEFGVRLHLRPALPADRSEGPRAYRPIRVQLFPEYGNDRDYPFEGAAQLTDLQALQHYTECYEYDPVGNFLKMFHRAAHRNWTRTYAYCEASLLEPAKEEQPAERDRAQTRPAPPVEPYSYDAHGNMTRMPHLPSMEWNYKDQLSATSRQVVNEGAPGDDVLRLRRSGQRARKVTESECGKRRASGSTSAVSRSFANFRAAK